MYVQESLLFNLFCFPDALVSLEQFWIEDIPFSVDLLKQFLEDMDAYSNVSDADTSVLLSFMKHACTIINYMTLCIYMYNIHKLYTYCTC